MIANKCSRIFFLSIALFSIQAPGLEIRLISETVGEDGVFNDTHSGLVIARIQQELGDQLVIKPEYASRSREWKMLENFPDVCLSNKIKTVERASKGVFAERAAVFFPPIRLISQRALRLPTELDLKQLKINSDLKIGIVNGRSYGSELDEFIRQHPDLFMPLYGNQGETRLRKMFYQGRYQAILEYPATIKNELQGGEEDRFKDFSLHALQQSNEYQQGFFVCSRSEQGNKAIALINQVLSNQKIEQFIVNNHRRFFGPEEAKLLELDIRDSFARKELPVKTKKL